MARKTTITGAGIRDDSVTGDDVDESTLILDTLRDADGDTKIQIEESADEDKIRFDTAGIERLVIDNSGNVGIATNLLFIDASTNSVGIGTASPDTAELLTIDGVSGNHEANIQFREDGSNRAKIGINDSDNLVLHNQSTNKHIVLKVNDAGVTREALRCNATVPEVVVNEGSESLVDFRVESDNNTHMLYVDGGNNKIGINDSTPTSTLTVQGSIAMGVLSINAANDPGTTYTISDTDCIILVNTRPTAQGGIDSAITLTLPDAASNPGMIITIKDAGGYADTNNITISRAGSDTIEGIATTLPLNEVAAFTTLVSNGASDWSEINKG